MGGMNVLHGQFLQRALVPLLLLLALLSGTAAAQNELEISAEMFPERIVLGEVATFRVTVTAPEKVDVTAPVFTDIENLQLLGPPSSSVQMSMGTGLASTWSLTLTWQFRALELGPFTIGPAATTFRGQQVESNTVRGEVINIPQQTPGDPTSRIPAVTGHRPYDEQLAGRYFLMYEAPAEVFAQQVVSVDSYIYRDASLATPIGFLENRASLGRDFLSLDSVSTWNNGRGFHWETVRLGDQSFQRALVNRSFFLATKSGDLQLVPPGYQIYLPTRSNRRDDPYAMFSQRHTEANFSPTAQRIRVKELPKPEEPAIATVVGAIHATAVVDRDTLPQHEAVTLTLALEGVGYLDTLAPPELLPIRGLTLVDTEVQGTTRPRGMELRSNRKFQFLFQASEAGTIKIPALTVAIFDPASGKYQYTKTQPVNLTVTPVSRSSVALVEEPQGGTPTESTPAVNRAGTEQVGSDVAWINTARIRPEDPRPHSQPFYTMPWFLLVQLAPPLLALVAGLLAMKSRAVDPSSAMMLSRRWRRESAQALKEAREKLAAPKHDDFYASLSRGVMTFAAALLGRSPSGLTLEDAMAGLGGAGCTTDALDAFRAVVTRADAVRYAPAEDTHARREEDLRMAEQAVAQLARGRKN